ncbi:MAG: porin [Acidobacteria bacterium]|nr:porin [Acidobacteriota bacterium]
MKFLKVLLILLALAMPHFPSVAGNAVDNLNFSGDLRLRYEYRDQDNVMNRGRARFRLRFNVKTKIDDNWSVGFRLASGSNNDPTSTNQSMDDNFTEKSIWIDRVYAVYKQGYFTFTGGKMANPFVSTNIIWDKDINPEGAAEQWFFGKTGYVTLSQMVLNENSAESDAYLVAVQGGLKFRYFSFNLAWYSFNNYVENAPAARGNLFENGTEYTLIDFLVKAHATDNLSFWAEYVRNTNANDTISTGNKENTAIGIGFSYRYEDWKFKAKYADIEPNAVAGAFSDSDFGYANRKGLKLAVERRLRKRVAFEVAFFDTKQSTDSENSAKTVQFDLKFKF